jgi:hypothetical protein
MKSQGLRDDQLDTAHLQQIEYSATIQPSVRLDPRPPNRGTLAPVEHAPMDCRAIGGARHQTIENVQLADQVTLADAADRRVAGHLPDVFAPKRDQSDAGAAPSRGGRGFTAGVAGPDDKNIVHGPSLADPCFT